MTKFTITALGLIVACGLTILAPDAYACWSDQCVAERNYQRNLSSGAYPSVAGNAYMRDVYGPGWRSGQSTFLWDRNDSTTMRQQPSYYEQQRQQRELNEMYRQLQAFDRQTCATLGLFCR